MRNLLLCLALCATLLAACGCMPVDKKKLTAANEIKLAKEGVTRLKAGQGAPAFSAAGTGGSTLTVATGSGLAEELPVLDAAIEPAADLAAPGAGSPPTSPAEAGAGTSTGTEGGPAVDAVDTSGSIEPEGPRLVLFFYPADDSPNSARHLLDLAAAEKLKAEGIEVYGVNPASLESHEAFARKYSIGLPLLTDPGSRICASYATLPEGGSFPQRTTVGIAPDGTIAFYERGVMLEPAILKAFGLVAEEEAPAQ